MFDAGTPFSYGKIRVGTWENSVQRMSVHTFILISSNEKRGPLDHLKRFLGRNGIQEITNIKANTPFAHNHGTAPHCSKQNHVEIDLQNLPANPKI